MQINKIKEKVKKMKNNMEMKNWANRKIQIKYQLE